VPNIVVIGASAGGVEALRKLVAKLPQDLSAAIFVVMHLSPVAPSVLPQLLDSAGPLQATAASNGEPIQPSRIYVAPPDHHLLLERGFMRLTRGPRENRFRPAIDPLFRTAAKAYGREVLGIVLTGALGDGTAGLQIIKTAGGFAMVQDPKEALFDSMPLSAISAVHVDFVLPTAEIARKIVELVPARWNEKPADPDRIKKQLSVLENQSMEEDERAVGRPSAFTCPDCSGTLWELERDGLLRYRCRVGHAFSEDSMHAGYSESVEAAFWTAVRVLEESAALERRLAEQAMGRGQPSVAARFYDVAKGREEQAMILKGLLLAGDTPNEIVTS
jgi:two-component system, chemotaxis family, protein-glutamate methylesterase/glutaminase